jgi:glycosyltransferase involved in cell wall biosynthesis
MKLLGAVPSKIYEAMASSLPILLIADGEPATRVRDAHCGLAASPGQVSELRDAFITLASDAELRMRMGVEGRRAAETIYNRGQIALRLDAFLKQCLPQNKAAREATLPKSSPLCQ